jgi:glycolate oxidase iron-sulfur subunit
LLKLLPEQLQAMEALAPKIGKQHTIPASTPAEGAKRLRVGLLLGCVQREFLSELNAATVRTLAAEGCEVAAPPGQPCCGALLVHAGEEEAALDLARRTISKARAWNWSSPTQPAAGR